MLTQQQGGGPGESEPTWIARVHPAAGISVAALLDMSLGLDVWERRSGSLVVAAPESRLAELERRHLAVVDRWATRADYEARMRNRPATEEDDLAAQGGPTPEQSIDESRSHKDVDDGDSRGSRECGPPPPTGAG